MIGIAQRGSLRSSTSARTPAIARRPISSGRSTQTPTPIDAGQHDARHQPGGPGEVPHERREPGDHERVQHPHRVEPAELVGQAVEQRGEPALHHPGIAEGGERVRVVPRDAAALDDEPAGGEVGEEAVVVERLEADQQAPHHEPGAHRGGEHREAGLSDLGSLGAVAGLPAGGRRGRNHRIRCSWRC
jgi:hypothetical protein